jgi:capsular polysaccharide biosynthesis protein
MSYLRALRRHWFIVTALTVLGGAAGYGFDVRFPPPAFEARLRLIAAFGPKPVLLTTAPQIADLLRVSPRLIESRIHTYVQLAAQPAVTDTVGARLRMPGAALAKKIRATSPLDSSYLDLVVIDADPTRAATIAGAVAAQLDNMAAHEVHSKEEASVIRLYVNLPTTVRARDARPIRAQRLGFGLVGGLALGLGAAVLRRRRLAVFPLSNTLQG